MITLLFYRSSGLPALLTRLWTRQAGQAWNDVPAHVSVQIGTMVYEATAAGVFGHPLRQADTQAHSISLTVPNEWNATLFLRDQEGKGYDWIAIFADVFARFLPTLAVRDLDNWRWDCSRLAAQALIEAGVTLPDSRLPMSPNDLLLWLRQGRQEVK